MYMSTALPVRFDLYSVSLAWARSNANKGRTDVLMRFDPN